MPHTAIIMVAPNGARKTARDHPGLPVTVEQTWQEAKRCFEAGASIIHAHVRGDQEEHVLDPDRYRQLLAKLDAHVPDLLVQVTTEAVGRYTPQQQAECVYALQPSMISMAVREMAGETADLEFARGFYHWCADNSVHVQHIVYDGADVARLITLCEQGVIPGSTICTLFVLGRYLTDRESEPGDIDPFLEAARAYDGHLEGFHWFVCAFGRHEHDCALRAIALGGHARIGFENNLLRPDGSIAASTAEQVATLKAAAQGNGAVIADAKDAARILGIR